jgi:hypothetical protein
MSQRDRCDYSVEGVHADISLLLAPCCSDLNPILNPQGVQADNAQPDAQYPVMLVLPRPPAQWPRFKRAISSVAPAASSRSRAAAVTMRLAVWRRRPGGNLMP